MAKIRNFFAFMFFIFCISAFAQEQPKVSPSIDRALWCGSLLAGMTRTEGLDKSNVDKLITGSLTWFASAKIELEKDRVPEADWEQIIKFYTHDAYEALDNEQHPMRHKPSECDL